MKILEKDQKVKIVRPDIPVFDKVGVVGEHIQKDSAGFSLYSIYFEHDSSTWHLREGDFEVLE
jgi:hypothetical protein